MSKPATIKKNLSIPTVLVTGGTGFIGSRVCAVLLEKNARVVALDNLSSGKEDSIKTLLANPNFAFYKADINLGIPTEIETVDYIFHLAGVEEYLFRRELINLDSLLTNSLGTKNLLDLAAKSEAKFVLASTTDVYQGHLSQLSLDKYFGSSIEEENKYSLVEAKRFGEALVHEYYTKYGGDVRIVRLPEVFGPGMNMDSSGTLGRILKNVIGRQDIVLPGDGTNKQYYLYVEDAVSGIIKAVFTPNTKGQIYSLVSDTRVTDLEIAYLVRNLADYQADIKFEQKASEYLYAAVASDTFNLADLRWEPKLDLKQALILTLQSLGYNINSNTFKPASLIQDKKRSKFESFGASDKKTSPVVMPLPIYPKQAEKFSVAGPDVSQKPTFVSSRDAQLLPAEHRTWFSNFPKLPKVHVNHNVAMVAAPLVAVILAGFFVFVAMPVWNFYYNIKSVQATFEKMDMSSASISTSLNSATRDLEEANKSLISFKWLFTVTGKKDLYFSTQKLISSLMYVSKSGNEFGVAAETMDSLWTVFRPDSAKAVDPEMFTNAKLSMGVARNNVKMALLEYNYVDTEALPARYREKALLYGKYLKTMDSVLDLSSSITSDLPKVLGIGGKKTYLIWFQNSNELRATGGFIGSYGILRFNNGKLEELVIDDIYNPDGQIDVRKIAFTPPAQIKEYLKESRMYLRNSNWDPDFPTAADTFDDLYFTVTGEKIDGYIAVDLVFAKNLLTSMGSIFLTAYNEEITADNLFERAQLHSDFNYTDGSMQKRSFLTVLGSKLLEKLLVLPKDKMIKVAESLQVSLDERHLMLYLKDSPLAIVLKDNKWDGSLVSTKGDYLYVVNSNLGGTKANYYVKNTLNYEVKSMTRDGILRGYLTLTYQHTGTDLSWPGGPYTNYLRVLTQTGSKLTGTKVVLNGVETNVMSKVAISEVSGYTSFGYGIKLNPKESIQLVFEYDLPTNLSIAGDQKAYAMYWQKQPGTQDDGFKFAFNPPFGMEIIESSESLTVADGSVQSEGLLNSDKEYSIRLK